MDALPPGALPSWIQVCFGSGNVPTQVYIDIIEGIDMYRRYRVYRCENRTKSLIVQEASVRPDENVPVAVAMSCVSEQTIHSFLFVW